MIHLGFFDSPEGTEAYKRLKAIITEAFPEYRRQFPAQVPESSEWFALTASEPRGPVSLDVSLAYGLKAAEGCLNELITLVDRNVPSNTIVFQTLLRTALMGAGHVLYVLGPSDPAERRANARKLRILEADSHRAALRAISDFSAMGMPKPSDEDLEAIDRLRSALRDGQSRTREGELLRDMIAVLAAQMAAEFPDLETAILTDMIGWVWNVYSGLAHGYGWPMYVPSTTPDGFTPMPGNFSADMSLVVSVGHFAFERAAHWFQPDTAGTEG